MYSIAQVIGIQDVRSQNLNPSTSLTDKVGANNVGNIQTSLVRGRTKMSHECPTCGVLCHCNGDIDDCLNNFEEDLENCTHCPDDEDESEDEDDD